MKKFIILLLCGMLFVTLAAAEEEEFADEVVDVYDEETDEEFHEDLTEEETVVESEDTENNGGDSEIISVPDGITVILGGNIVKFDAAQPKLVEGRTLVPMRKIFEALGATVFWDSETATAKAEKDDMSVEISIGSRLMYNSGKTIEIDVPAQIFYDRTYVPVRFVSEALGAEVSWDEYKKIVYINS